jgi:hypothetical protein
MAHGGVAESKDDDTADESSVDSEFPVRVAGVFDTIEELYAEVIEDNNGYVDKHDDDHTTGDSAIFNYQKFLNQLKALEKSDFDTTHESAEYNFKGYLLSFALHVYDLVRQEFPDADAAAHTEIVLFENIIYHILKEATKRDWDIESLMDFKENKEILEKYSNLKKLFKGLYTNADIAESAFPFPMKWMHSLDLKYGRRPSRPSSNFASETDHYELMMQTVAHQKSVGSKGNPNTAFAGISFIIKDKNYSSKDPGYIQRYYMPISAHKPLSPAEIPEFMMHVDKHREWADKLEGRALTDTKRFVEKNYRDQAPITVGKPCSDLMIKHSEQAIFAYLQDSDNLQILVEQLREKINESHPAYDDSYGSGLEEIEIRAIVIHIHSHLYMCQNCQVAALGFQHPDSFMAKISKVLEAEDFVVSEKLVVPIIVSSHQPFPLKLERHRMEAEDHKPGEIDIKLLPKGVHIFGKDLTAGITASSSTPFYSRAAVSTALALERRIRKLEAENVKLRALAGIKETTSDEENDAPTASGAGASLGAEAGYKRKRGDSRTTVTSLSSTSATAGIKRARKASAQVTNLDVA